MDASLVVLVSVGIINACRGIPTNNSVPFQKRIVGGDFANDYTNFRSFARIYQRKEPKGGWTHVCGGALIEDRKVITHVSCVWNKDKKSVVWADGKLAVNVADYTWPSDDEEDTGQGTAKIKCIYFNRDYEEKPSEAHDGQFAIIHLEEQFDNTSHVGYLPVCTSSSKVEHSYFLRSVGMGQWIKDRDNNECAKLRQLDVKAVDCNLENSTDPNLTAWQPDPNSLVCYNAENECHRKGDIGSPTYLIDKDTERAKCVYSIFYWYENDKEGCTPGSKSVHGKLSYFRNKASMFSFMEPGELSRQHCGPYKACSRAFC